MRAMACARWTAAVLSVAAVSWAARAPGGELPTWTLAEMKGLSDAQWLAAADDGAGGRCRAARARRTARLTAPAWWGKTFRPPAGTVYVLKVAYRDTAATPAVFYTHAGLAAHWGLSEVHRFGGAADGKWKVADVPVSWDLLCRQAGGDTTVLAVRAGKDLPIRQIRVAPAGAGAAEKYFRETREWIARAQAAQRQAADRGPKQKPVIPAAMADQPIVPYVRTWMAPLQANAAPQAGEAGAAIRLRMARNEYEPVALAVYANGRALTDVTYTVGPLTGPAGRLKCELDLRTAEYSAVQAVVDYGAGKDCGKYRMYPQRLWPAYPVDIAAGQSHLFWITVRTLGPASKPGRYAGHVRITARTGEKSVEARLPIEVEVLPVMLLTMTQAGLSLGNCTLGLPSAQEVRTLVGHNHNRMDIWFGCTKPGMEVRDGKLRLDWTYLDDWMGMARRAGMTEMMWFLGGDPKDFPRTLNLERSLYRARPGNSGELYREFLRKSAASPEKVLPEIRGLYVDFVRQTAAHAKANNWPKLILQPFDEPGKWDRKRPANTRPATGAGPWIKDHFKDACALIRKGAPDIRVGLEAHVVPPCMVFVKDVDVFCTNRAWQVPDLAEQLARAKVAFWQYANCDDQAPAHRMRYGFGFYFGAFGSKGFLVWAYNWWGRFDTARRVNWGSGWPTPFGAVFAPSLVGLREGLDDRRWMEALRRRPGSKALLAAIAKEALAARAKTRYTSYNEADDPAKMDRWRNRIIDALRQLEPRD